MYSCFCSVTQLCLFATPLIAACQASLSFTISQSLLKTMSPSSRWCHPTISPSVIPFSCLQSYLAPGSYLMCWLFTSGVQSIGVSASASVLPINIQDWFPLGWTGLISLLFQGTLKNLLQHHISNVPILWCSAVFMVQLSHPYMTTGKTIALTRWTFVGKVMSLIFNTLSRFVIQNITRNKWQWIHDYSKCISSVHLLSRVWLCDPMDRSTPGLPVNH